MVELQSSPENQFKRLKRKCVHPQELKAVEKLAFTVEVIVSQIFSVTSQKTKSARLKARSHDPFLRIQFLVLKTGSRRSDGRISRFRFCGENVGRSFAVCSHDPFFRTNKESSIWLQNDHAKFVGAFHLSRRVSDENRACSISIRFYKIMDPFDGRSFLMCSHDPFFRTNKN